MKKALAIFIFSLFALRPAYNVGYALYYQLNIDYIIETYCVNKEKPKLQCNGKCHLMKQLTMDNSTSDEQPTFRIVEAFFPLYFQEISEESITEITTFSEKVTAYYVPIFSDDFIATIDHPPQV